MKSVLQNPLQLKLTQHQFFSNFYGSYNKVIVNKIMKFINRDYFNQNHIFISGQKDSGKTHLLNSICYYSSTQKIKSIYINIDEVLNPIFLEGLEHYEIICIDNIDRCLHDIHWNEAIFNLMTQVSNNNGLIFFTSEKLSYTLFCKYQDLDSRLKQCNQVIINILSDIELTEAIFKFCTLKSIEITQKEIEYIFKYNSRNISKVFQIIVKLDRYLLAMKQKRITISLLKKYLTRNEELSTT